MKSGLRIIGGKYRGKKLPVPDAPGLRPSTDRIRETVFNWLMHDIPGARCLDAFAGSGALGFEALSRGASEVVLLENNKRVFSQLEKTAAQFSGELVTVLHENALAYMARQKRAFDIIFLDPPFEGKHWSACIDALFENACLSPESLIYIEAPEHWMLEDSRLECLKHKEAGQVSYRLYRQAPGFRSPDDFLHS